MIATPATKNNLLDTALQYAAWGWAVIPRHTPTSTGCSCGKDACSSIGKHPRTHRGMKDATTDEATIRQWWEQWPGANIGVVTGATSGIIVIDDDSDSDNLPNCLRDRPQTLVAKTGRGRHIIFRHPGGEIKNRTKVQGLPIDVRGDGGYIVAPGSLHASGITYEWITNPQETPLADPPQSLLDWLANRVPLHSHLNIKVPPADDVMRRARAYLAQCPPAIQGSNGSATLMKTLRLLDATFELDADQFRQLASEYSDRCVPPWSDKELDHACANVRKPPSEKASDRNGHTQHAAPPPPPPSDQASNDWPKPKPLPGKLLPVDPFDYALLPDSFRGFVEDIADRMQAPPDYSAVSMMITAAAAIGNKVCVRPKRKDDWIVSPNLWGAGIGRPGLLKSPAIEEPLKLLQAIEIEAKKNFEREMAEYMLRSIVADEKKKAQKSAIKEAIAQGADPMDAAKAAVVEDEKPPTCPRYITNDSTVEKLGVILSENPQGVLAFRDELVGLIENLSKEGQEGARSFYLEAWNGLGSFTYDRISRGTIYIPKACLSILGTIQPGRLLNYLSGAIECGKADDGLLQRFQLSVYPDLSGEWINVDRWPDTKAKAAARETIQRLEAR